MNYSVISSAPAPRQDCVIRVLCILCGISMIGMSVLLYAFYPASKLLENLLQFYYMYKKYSLFGFTMIILELDLKIIKKYWRFLIEVFGKGMFYIL